MLTRELSNREEDQAVELITKLPWKRLVPDQIIRLFHEVHAYQEDLARHASLDGFSAPELTDLLEELTPEALDVLVPTLEKTVPGVRFSLEDIEILAGLPHDAARNLVRLAGPPSEFDAGQLRAEFRDAIKRIREILFLCTRDSEAFTGLFAEAWEVDPAFVKGQVRLMSPTEIGPFLVQASGNVIPKVVQAGKSESKLVFGVEAVDGLFTSLPKTKKQAALRHFTKGHRGAPEAST